jgi:hypothetical protein
LLDEERGDRSINFGNDFADYTVYDIDYEKIGKVDDVFVDESDQPCYIGVKMGFLDIRLTLIPVKLIRVNDRRRLVEVAASKEVVEEGPTFSDDRELTTEFEQQVLDYYEVENYAAGRQLPGRCGVDPLRRRAPREGRSLLPARQRGTPRRGNHRGGAAKDAGRSPPDGTERFGYQLSPPASLHP